MNVQTFGQVTLHLEILNVFREMPKSSLRKRFDKIADNLAPPPKKKKILDKGIFWGWYVSIEMQPFTSVCRKASIIHFD